MQRVSLTLTAAVLLLTGCTVTYSARPVYQKPYSIGVDRPALRPVEIPSSINGRPVLLQDRCKNPTILDYVAGPDGRLYARKVC